MVDDAAVQNARLEKDGRATFVYIDVAAIGDFVEQSDQADFVATQTRLIVLTPDINNVHRFPTQYRQYQALLEEVAAVEFHQISLVLDRFHDSGRNIKLFGWKM